MGPKKIMLFWKKLTSHSLRVHFLNSIFDPLSVKVPSLPFISLEEHRKRLHRFKMSI